MTVEFRNQILASLVDQLKLDAQSAFEILDNTFKFNPS